MKNNLIAGALAGTMFAGVAQAAEIVGAPPSDVKKGSTGLALEYTYQRLEMRRDDGFGQGINSYNTDIKTTSLKASHGISDGTAFSLRVGKLGGGTTLGGTNGGGPNSLRGTGEEGDLWGIGVETVLYRSGPVAVGANGRFTQLRYHGDSRRTNTSGVDRVNLIAGDLGLGLGYAVNSAFTAYGGLLLQKIRGSNIYYTPSPQNTTELTQGPNTGGYIGVRYQLPGRFSIGAEAHKNSTYGANVGVQF